MSNENYGQNPQGWQQNPDQNQPYGSGAGTPAENWGQQPPQNDQWSPASSASASQWGGPAGGAQNAPGYGQSAPSQPGQGYGQAPTGGQPQGYGQSGGYGQPGGYGGGQNFGGPGSPSGPGGPYGGGPQGPGSAPKKNLTPMIIAGVVVVALLAAIGAWAATRDKGGNAGKSATPVTTAPVSTPAETPGTESSTPKESPTESATPKGDRATIETVIAKLEEDDFTCTDESGVDFTSKYCTHFESAPYVAVYVGGTKEGELKRMGVDFSATTVTAAYKSYSTWAIEEFFGSSKSASVKAKIASGTNNTPATGTLDKSRYRGDKDGQIAMWDEGWPKPVPAIPAIKISGQKVSAAAKAGAYTCVSEQVRILCTKKVGTATYEFSYRGSVDGSSIVSWSSRALNAPASQANAIIIKQLETMFAGAPADQLQAVKSFVAEQDPDAGGAGFAGDLLLDFFPAGGTGTSTASLYQYGSCWADLTKWC